MILSSIGRKIKQVANAKIIQIVNDRSYDAVLLQTDAEGRIEE